MSSGYYLYKERTGILYIMIYLRKYSCYILVITLIILAYNLYFIYLVPGANTQYLIYFDVVVGVCLLSFIFLDFMHEKNRLDKKKDYLQSKEVICFEFDHFDNIDIAYHDVHVLQKQLDEIYQVNNDLQDYMTKWCHEIKIPLSASLLINQKNTDYQQKQNMQEQLEKMNQYLNQIMVVSRIQSQIHDIYIKPVSLKDSVYQSIKNNQFFLINKHFEMDVNVEDLQIYSDKTWLIYVLDQIINNAIKYAKESPQLKIWSEHHEEQIDLYIEDNGEGIQSQDLPRIFEKGFTGQNHHNGQYKSTGMGVYMVEKAISQLGHSIEVDSAFQEFTRVHITFRDQRDYFYR